MTFPEAFISLIEQQPELFTSEDITDLAQQQWSDNPDKLGNQVYDWTSGREKKEIHQATLINLKALSVRENIYQAPLDNLSAKEKQRDLASLAISSQKANKVLSIQPEEYKTKLLDAIKRNLINSPQTVT